MFGYIVAGAVAIDALATGVFIGHRWGAASWQAAVSALEGKVASVEAAIGKPVAAVEAVVAEVKAKL